MVAPARVETESEEILLGKMIALIEEYHEIQGRLAYDRRNGLNVESYHTDPRTHARTPARFLAEKELEGWRKRMSRFREKAGEHFGSLYTSANGVVAHQNQR